MLPASKMRVSLEELEELERRHLVVPVPDCPSTYQLATGRSVLDLARYVADHLPGQGPRALNAVLKAVLGPSLANLRVLNL